MDDRKARLKALAAKAGRTKEASADDAQGNEAETAASRVNFRNYTPADDRLDPSAEPSPKKAKTVETKEKSVLEKALEEAKAEIPNLQGRGDDLVAMAPKKINWDLKRDIQPKLDKLEKRTQKAIVEMLRDRLEKEAAEDLD